MKITITIDTDGAAFSGEGRVREVCLLLHKIIQRFSRDDATLGHLLWDTNGNRCGKVVIEEAS